MIHNVVFLLLQKGRPMAVGGIGMITTANYIARKYVFTAFCEYNSNAFIVNPCLQIESELVNVRDDSWMQVWREIRNARVHSPPPVP